MQCLIKTGLREKQFLSGYYELFILGHLILKRYKRNRQSIDRLIFRRLVRPLRNDGKFVISRDVHLRGCRVMGIGEAEIVSGKITGDGRFIDVETITIGVRPTMR